MFRWALRRWNVACLLSRLTVAAALVAAVGLAAPAAAQISDQPPAVRVYMMTPERMTASVAMVMALIGAIVGALALARSGGRIGNGRRGAIVALVLGPIGVAIGGLVVATAKGGLGTGHGLGGGVVAIVLGLIAICLAGLALARSRRTGIA